MIDSIEAESPDDMLPQYDSVLGESWEEYKKQKAAFLANPPPCGERVEFRIDDPHNGLVGSIYWFDAGDVQTAAEKMIKHDPQMTGLRELAKWTSLRDTGQPSPSLVSPLLSTFSHIAFELIEADKGQVSCPLCEKLYQATDLEEGDRRNGGYFSKTYSCPEKHELINRLEMHIMLKDNRS